MVERTILTYSGLQTIPDDGLRRELLGGELYVSPAPSPPHQSVVGEVFVTLRNYAKQHGGKAFVSPIDVVFTETDATEPDVIYLTPDRLPLIGDKYIRGAPSLVVEVLSPASSDVDPGRKLKTYAKYGVPEYWIIDPKSETTFAHAEPSGEGYVNVVQRDDGVVESLTLLDLRFALQSGTPIQ